MAPYSFVVVEYPQQNDSTRQAAAAARTCAALTEGDDAFEDIVVVVEDEDEEPSTHAFKLASFGRLGPKSERPLLQSGFIDSVESS